MSDQPDPRPSLQPQPGPSRFGPPGPGTQLPPPGPQQTSLQHPAGVTPRGVGWRAFRGGAVLWAAFWALAGATGLTSGDPVATIVAGVVLCVLIGGAPLALQRLFAPSEKAQLKRLGASGVQAAQGVHGAAAAGPGPSQFAPAAMDALPELQTLARIDELARELAERQVLPQSDLDAVTQRSATLRDLARADQRSVALGGQASPVVSREITQLHHRLSALFDAAIDAQAASPSGEDVEARLEGHLLAMQGRVRAVDELRELESHLRQTGDLRAQRQQE